MTGKSKTEIVLQAIPKIPSNLEAKKEIPIFIQYYTLKLSDLSK